MFQVSTDERRLLAAEIVLCSRLDCLYQNKRFWGECA